MAVLALDVSGLPRKWVSFDDAITYKAKNLVAWTMGNVVAKYNGGIRKDGTKSYLETHSIIAIKGTGFNPGKFPTVSLTNRTLFGRDRHMCAYCGHQFMGAGSLSRDHIVARSRGGSDTWMNVVTSCKVCNQRKGDRTLKEARMELLYVPYVPSFHESLILQNRSILADQMEYLISGVPKHSRLLVA
jgi:5-methylcytosine-specific restriction endonuclease McrA